MSTTIFRNKTIPDKNRTARVWSNLYIRYYLLLAIYRVVPPIWNGNQQTKRKTKLGTVKNFPAWLLISSLPFILARNLALIPYYALYGQSRVILKSKIDALRGVPRMLEKRKDIVRKASSAEIGRFMKTWSSMKRQ